MDFTLIWTIYSNISVIWPSVYGIFAYMDHFSRDKRGPYISNWVYSFPKLIGKRRGWGKGSPRCRPSPPSSRRARQTPAACNRHHLQGNKKNFPSLRGFGNLAPMFALHLPWGNISHFLKLRGTSCGHRMADRKWKEGKQQPSMLLGPAVPGSCLVSFYFLSAILCPQAVHIDAYA